VPESRRFSRTELLIGMRAMENLRNSSAAVFGVGGVGSFAAEALARSGVGRLILIDNDIVCETNINRQVHALGSTVGMPKVEVMKNRILDINPEAVVETLRIFYLPGTDSVSWDYDYAIDAVDTVAAKLDIILEAKKRGIPVISAMGAGNKLDPTKFETADIYETSVCPLARVMRRELRKRGVESLKVVYSKEPPISPGMPADLEGEGAQDESVTANPADIWTPGETCRRVTASIAFVPSVMGLIIAGEVIKDLIIRQHGGLK